MRLSLFAAVALVASSIAAHADVTYTYTGQEFTFTSGQYTTSDQVTGTFVLATPFIYTGPGFQYFTPESYSFSDGVQTLTSSANLPFVNFYGNTDAQGNFEYYDIDISDGLNVILVDGINGDEVRNGSSEGTTPSTGTLTEQTMTVPTAMTPEPSSITLLSTGILGMAGVVKRRLT